MFSATSRGMLVKATVHRPAQGQGRARTASSRDLALPQLRTTVPAATARMSPLSKPRTYQGRYRLNPRLTDLECPIFNFQRRPGRNCTYPTLKRLTRSENGQISSNNISFPTSFRSVCHWLSSSSLPCSSTDLRRTRSCNFVLARISLACVLAFKDSLSTL
jgi:hypothetical protein